MCGDLEEYDPGKHVDLLLDGINKHIGRPRIVSSSTWAQDIADLELNESNKELLSHFWQWVKRLANTVLKENSQNQSPKWPRSTPTYPVF